MDLTILRTHLPKELQTLPIIYQKDSISTMLDAKNTSKSPVLILASDQKKAHGRFARPFFTHAEGGIYLSLKIPLSTQQSTTPQVTILTAVALCQAIEEISSQKPSIKWVNDLYLQGKKIAGILAEGILDLKTQRLKEIILGVGFNYQIPQAAFPKELQPKVTSLFSTKVPPVSKEAFLALFITYFFQLLKEDPQAVLVAYKKRSFILGRQVSFTYKGINYSGEALDIAFDGSLVIKLPNGENLHLHSGEISLTSF